MGRRLWHAWELDAVTAALAFSAAVLLGPGRHWLRRLAEVVDNAHDIQED